MQGPCVAKNAAITSKTSSSGLACKGQRLIESQGFFLRIEGTGPLPHRIRPLQVKGALKMAPSFCRGTFVGPSCRLCHIRARLSGGIKHIAAHKGLHMLSSSLDDAKKPSTIEFRRSLPGCKVCLESKGSFRKGLCSPVTSSP